MYDFLKSCYYSSLHLNSIFLFSYLWNGSRSLAKVGMNFTNVGYPRNKTFSFCKLREVPWRLDSLGLTQIKVNSFSMHIESQKFPRRNTMAHFKRFILNLYCSHLLKTFLVSLHGYGLFRLYHHIVNIIFYAVTGYETIVFVAGWKIALAFLKPNNMTVMKLVHWSPESCLFTSSGCILIWL